MDAPAGYKWVHYEMRHGRRYKPGPWVEIVFVSADMHGAKFKVLVKITDSATKSVDPGGQSC